MHGNDQDMMVGGQAQQQRSNQRAGSEIEGLLALVAGEAAHLRFLLGLGVGADFNHIEVERRPGMDELFGSAALGIDQEGGAQGVVATKDFAEGAFEPSEVE